MTPKDAMERIIENERRFERQRIFMSGLWAGVGLSVIAVICWAMIWASFAL